MYIKIFRTIVHMRLSSPSVTYPFAARMNFHYKHSAYILFSSIALRNFFTPPKKTTRLRIKNNTLSAPLHARQAERALPITFTASRKFLHARPERLTNAP